MTRIHVLRHLPFDDGVSTRQWAALQNVTLTETHIPHGGPFPSVDDFDGLIVLGSFDSACDDSPSWIVEEEKLLRKVIDRDIPLFGVCFGAQMAARALGAQVTQNEEGEFGWGEVVAADAANESRYFSPEDEPYTIFASHRDTFALPEGAALMGSNDACRNQAFELGRTVGIQYHLEYTPENIADIVTFGPPTSPVHPFVQSEEEIFAGLPYSVECHERYYSMLDAIFIFGGK